MRKHVLLLIVFAAVGILLFLGVPEPLPTGFHERYEASVYRKSYPAEPPQNAAVRVSRVIDGDTIEIEGGARVRYIGVNAPESVDPREPVQCFGSEASNKNKELVEGRLVRLERDVSDRDRYGRLLRYVYLLRADGTETLVNRELVRLGYASADTFPPDVRYADAFRAAEEEARAAGRGFWNTCKNTQTLDD